MLLPNNISLSFALGQFKCTNFDIDELNYRCDVELVSNQNTEDVTCPICGGKVHIRGYSTVTLKDMPVYPGINQYLHVQMHQYRCQECGISFTENIDFKHPQTRVTLRAAKFVSDLLKHKMTIKSVQEITGIHWDTISKIHKMIMNNALMIREFELKEKGYKPKRLAIDEFAIHKGHTYATCVMDLDEGDILWVGKGRSIAAFEEFFKEIDMDYLSEVEAVAMDMNASYNRLVEEHLPHAVIVYDRYHMQAQFGKDVIGSVRLQEAREHHQRAKELELSISKDKSKEEIRALKDEIKTERKTYSTLKKSRWTLLMNGKNLSEEKAESLDAILQNHDKLAICYAMKEELCELFEIRDKDEAEKRWIAWFDAAEASGIEQLVKFAELKRKRLPGLISHAEHPISTGKLEGFNNKIKVAKRIGFGYRNEEYFFTLIKYSSLPCNRNKSPK